MSNLKHLTLEQLRDAHKFETARTTTLSKQLGGAQERLKWIDFYIKENTVVDMTVEQIAAKLGHKLRIVR